ncbi:MAG: pyrroline-5-carboxylate reductase [Clostridia bacterium]|nr:pyrroline-5-carboxylate reductase [Clostridia bacterium]
MSEKIGFIGAGNMATAIISGILSKNLYSPENVYAYDTNPEAVSKISKKNVTVCSGIDEILALCPIVFLAVKPQVYPTVLGQCSGSVKNNLFVSIAAGISTKYVQSFVGENCAVIRAMPNTPLMLGSGATALCKSANTSDAQFEKVEGIFAASGVVCRLPEDKMNAVISVNGSSPAYVYLFAKAVIEGAKDQGIDPETAAKLIISTLRGSADMLENSGYTPDELIKMVSSPGGTTLKALDVLYAGNFETVIKVAMRACTGRAEELGK